MGVVYGCICPGQDSINEFQDECDELKWLSEFPFDRSTGAAVKKQLELSRQKADEIRAIERKWREVGDGPMAASVVVVVVRRSALDELWTGDEIVLGK